VTAAKNKIYRKEAEMTKKIFALFILLMFSGCAGMFRPSVEAQKDLVHTAIFRDRQKNTNVCSQLFVRDGLLVVAHAAPARGPGGAEMYIYSPNTGLLINTHYSASVSITDGSCAISIPFGSAHNPPRIDVGLQAVVDDETRVLLQKIAADPLSVEPKVMKAMLTEQNESPFAGSHLQLEKWEAISTYSDKGRAFLERVNRYVKLRKTGSPLSFEYVGHFSFNAYDELFSKVIALDRGKAR
jgi:hypothetical protein